jgi:hypothetical protein
MAMAETIERMREVPAANDRKASAPGQPDADSIAPGGTALRAAGLAA